MEQLNRIEIRGNVGNVNILKVGNTRVAHFSVATNFAYKDRNGETVYTTDVVADRVEFLGSAGGENSASDGRNPQGGRTAQDAPQNGDLGGGFSTLDEDVPWS